MAVWMKTHLGRNTAAGLLLASIACSGGSSSPAGPGPVTRPSTTPTPTPTPAGTVGAAALCGSLGEGSGDYSCDASAPAYLDEVDAAIVQLVSQKPAIFNLNFQTGEGYKVVDVDAYYQGVIDNLATRGLCAAIDIRKRNADVRSIQVKKTNGFSEDYSILTEHNYARRGPTLYEDHCTPANFPLTAQDVIASVRVGFFGFTCPAGVQPPIPSAGKLPKDCTGVATATPKDDSGQDVDARIHGNTVSWEMFGDGVIDINVPNDGNLWNEVVVARDLGHFSLCATVQGVVGCLNGEVIP